MKGYSRIIEKLAKFISICMMVSAVFLTLYGVILIIEGIGAFYRRFILHHQDANVILYFVEAIDIFLISLVFIIFGLGVSELFSFDKERNSELPEWLTIKSFGQLKMLLMETVVASSFVFFISNLVRQDVMDIGWELTVLPASILLLSISLYLFKKE